MKTPDNKEQPSEHAMRAANTWAPNIAEEYRISLAKDIDLQAIDPAVAEVHNQLDKLYQQKLAEFSTAMTERDQHIAALEAALKPFAELADGGFAGTIWEYDWRMDNECIVNIDHRTGKKTTLEDFRRARAVLAKSERSAP